MGEEREKKILRAVEQSDPRVASNHADFIFWCPGCNEHHGVWTRKKNSQGAQWQFDDNMDRPTFSPSILIRYTNENPNHPLYKKGQAVCCHLFVKNGMLEFLSDSTHPMAGKTIPMEAC